MKRTGLIGAVLAHKAISLAVLGGLVWVGLAANSRLRTEPASVSYVTEAAAVGTVVASVFGTGQVTSANQAVLKPGTAGQVVKVNVGAGDRVSRGQTLAVLDSGDLAESIREAETALETARLQMERLVAPPDEYAIARALDAVGEAEAARDEAERSLADAYRDAYAELAEVYLSLPGIMTELDGILHDSDLNGYQADIDAYADLARRYDAGVDAFRDVAASAYAEARSSFDRALAGYAATDRQTGREGLEAAVYDSQAAAEDLFDAIRKAQNLIDFAKDALVSRGHAAPTQAESDRTKLKSLTASANSAVSRLNGIARSIKGAKDSLAKAEKSVRDKQASYDEMMRPADAFDVRSQNIAISQRESALRKARESHADYVVVAPFDGLIAEVGVRAGDSVTSGTSVLTLIADGKTAEISLNEIDVVGVRVGQKATLEFDAISGFSATGTVSEVAAIGTASQGVVSYGVKVSIDSEDERIMVGMNVSVSVLTEAASGVIAVANSAVKAANGQKYVEVLEDDGQGQETPVRKTVETGLMSDTRTAVLSGLREGELVIIRTTTTGSSAPTGANAASAQQSGSILNMMGTGGQRNAVPDAGGFMMR